MEVFWIDEFPFPFAGTVRLLMLLALASVMVLATSSLVSSSSNRQIIANRTQIAILVLARGVTSELKSDPNDGARLLGDFIDQTFISSSPT
ncbi:hypothetical protein BSZ21_04840 [Bradyrhizobium canariense]|nr:hypothetical protein BSZ21_04840 [Bradyrhizobium canariense]